MVKQFILLFLLSIPTFSICQGVGINEDGSSPNNGAILDIASDTKGVLFPRTSSASIISPSEGMIIFDTLQQRLKLYVSAGWHDIMILEDGSPFIRQGTQIKQKSNFTTDDFLFGTSSITDTSIFPQSNLIYFNKSTGGFRGGSYTEQNSFQVLGSNSFAYGSDLKATGFHSASFGNYNQAIGNSAFAIGSNNIAKGPFSFASGKFSVADGYYSASMGYNVQAYSAYETALGVNGKVYTPLSTSTWESNDQIFSIGNGVNSASRRNAMTILKNGKTGIGDVVPLARLHINATSEDYLILDAYGVRKLTLKKNANQDLLFELQSTNTFFGKDNGEEFTSGTNNSFFGRGAGFAFTSGNYNVLLGAESGRNSSGDFNTYVGYASGSYISGSNNVCIGRSAGQSNSGSNRLYIHNEASNMPLIYGEFDNRVLKINGVLKASGGLSDEDEDTKVWVEKTLDDDLIRFDLEGDEKMLLIKNNADYARLDFVGNNANTLIGTDAGAILSETGINNTFLGNSSGENNSTGSNNAFIGYFAGQANTGSSNTFVGTSTGAYSGSGSYNVFIGHAAGSNSSSDHRLFIDNSSALEPLIYGEFDNNKVEINGGLSIDNFLASTSQPSELQFKTTGNVDYSLRSNPVSKYFVIREDHTSRDIFFLEDGRIGIKRRPTTNVFEVNGTASKSSAGDWIANSDARLKKNIANLSSDDILQKIVSLQGITYQWNDHRTGFDRPVGIQFGFTAQNIAEQFPTLVIPDAAGYLQTSYGTFDAMYVESFKALLSKIEALNKEKAHQATQICDLQNKLKNTNALLDQINERLSAVEINN